MAMPLCEGRTLTQVVNDEPEFITEAWLKSILAPLLDAIEALHSVHIFHRDIAPDNVFIQENGAPILLDFGAARQIVSDMTQALTVILKPGYAPIEQYAEDASMKQGPWTDIYALGAVIYFALTRKAPPNSVTRLVNDTYQPLVKVLGTSYSEGFLAAVDAALVIRPEGRPQTIDAMRELLGLPRITPPPKTQLNPRASSPAHRTGSLTNSVPTITDADATMIVPRKTAAPASGVTLSPALAAQEAPSAPDVPAPVTAAPASPAPARRKEGMGTVALIAVGVAILVAGALVTFWRINSQPAAGLRADSETAVKSEAAKPSDAVAPAPQAGVVAPVSTAAAPSAPAPSPVAQPALPAGAKAAEAAAASAIGTLQIAVKPWGEVLVDGGSKGVSPPLKQLKLAAGKHKVEFANPGFPSYATEIEIQKGRSVTVSYQFK
jgi:hypothetical protein